MSSSDIAVSVRGVSKAYTIAHNQEQHYTLAETVLARVKNPFKRAQKETFWALRDVSFEIKKGDVVGIIGRNGAGKSTLLKILSRITGPTKGEIDIYGRVGSLLEVGTGFHPELTGRENIFLNGAILGMNKAEIRKQFDAIVDFAGVEQFLDTPVKRYSSGMYVRLAFAVAAHLRSEILIVDEVLAVGDAEFQKKCLGKMKDVAGGGRTVFFVSHNMAAVANLCNKGILLVRGEIGHAASISQVIESYVSQGDAGGGEWQCREAKPNSPLIIERVTCVVDGAQPTLTLLLDVRVKTQRHHAPAMLAFDISDSLGDVLMQALPAASGFITPNSKSQNISVVIELPPLIPGRYDITLWAGPHNTETFDFAHNCVSFEVVESPTRDRTFPHTRDHGQIVPISRILLAVDQQTLQGVN